MRRIKPITFSAGFSTADRVLEGGPWPILDAVTFKKKRQSIQHHVRKAIINHPYVDGL